MYRSGVRYRAIYSKRKEVMERGGLARLDNLCSALGSLGREEVEVQLALLTR